MIGGYLFVGALPARLADHVFDRFARYQRRKFAARIDRDPAAKRMRILLTGSNTDQDIQAHVARYHEWRTEDAWGRWQASHKSDWPVRTEVQGLQHVDTALNAGRGVVFWGMSFCGTLFSKIALSNAGVALTQLSTADHGAWYPLTMLGKRVAGPLHCLPEDRYLVDRVFIPVDGNNRYLFRLGDALKNKGCVWIAGERSRVKKSVAGKFLGRFGRFPAGAPTLALRHNAALLPVYTERLDRLHYRVVIEPPVPLRREAKRSTVIDQAVQDYAQRLNRRVLGNPGDWEWDHLWVRELLSESAED
jgi:lauroyl/myristoyl acyltransferase